NFCRKKLQRLEDKEEIPFRFNACGRGRKRVCLLAQLPWEDGCERRQRADSQKPADEIAQEEVWKELHLLQARALVLLRHAHAMHLNQQNVYANQCCGSGGKHGDVKAEEARECCARHVIAAAQETNERAAYEGNNTCAFCSDLRSKEGELVPGEQVTAKAETDGEEKKQHARDPCHLARPAIRPHKEDAEHVYEERQDQQIG